MTGTRKRSEASDLLRVSDKNKPLRTATARLAVWNQKPDVFRKGLKIKLNAKKIRFGMKCESKRADDAAPVKRALLSANKLTGDAEMDMWPPLRAFCTGWDEEEE